MFKIPSQKPLEPSAPLPPLHAAARAGDLDALIPLLQDSTGLDTLDADGRTALHWGSAEGHWAIVNALLGAGASLETPNPRGETALSFAVTYGQAPVVRLLLRTGANREIYPVENPDDSKPLTPEQQRLLDDANTQLDKHKQRFQRRLERQMGQEDVAQWQAELKARQAQRSDSKQIPLLIRAIRSGSTDTLAALLEDDNNSVADSSDSDLTGSTPLNIAMMFGNEPMTDTLLAHGTAAQASGALFMSVAMGNHASVRRLLESGADPNYKGENDQRPVLVALVNGDAPMLDLLMEFGAQLESPDDEVSSSYRHFINEKPDLKEVVRRRQRTVWTDAVETGDIKAVRTALDRGADVNVVRDDKETPLLIAVKRGDTAMVELLLDRGANVNQPGEYGITALHEAITKATISMVRVLLAAGADSNHGEGHGRTPLQYASQQLKWDIADLLESKGAIAYPSDIALRGDTVRLRRLWEGGTLVDTPNPAGMTALMGAVMRGNQPLIDNILARGANINAKDSTGDTPLHYAMQRDHAGVFAFLLEQGAVPTSKDKSGYSLLCMSLMCGKLEAARLLLKAGHPIGTSGIMRNQPLEHAALFFDRVREQVDVQATENPVERSVPPAPERMRLLLDFGGNVNAVNYDGETLLTAAIKEKASANLALLLERGADVNLANDDEETPLIVAIKERDSETARQLVQRGADVNRDWQGTMPLDLAERMLPDLTDWLRRRGARNADTTNDSNTMVQARRLHLDILAESEGNQTPLALLQRLFRGSKKQ